MRAPHTEDSGLTLGTRILGNYQINSALCLGRGLNPKPEIKFTKDVRGATGAALGAREASKLCKTRVQVLGCGV